MSSRRAPSMPPEIPGFTYVQLLGSGGFADVFLYQQQLPKRRVAVKVLLTEGLTAGSVADFTAEANVMAQLSTHPAIVTIYQADVAIDGRPYLAMEYCPKANLQSRYRKANFSVAEALRVGIQVAGAVETAHRAGILHRDIKPANILVTEYNRPALTDFGIAGTTMGAADSVGMSIPWSPPEAFDATQQSSVHSDVFALAATVYTLLAGRSPFEVPGGKNSGADIISRIQGDPLAPLGRADVPISLDEALAKGMAKLPQNRHQSALELARALQKVQIELSMSVTPVDVIDDSVDDSAGEDEDDGHTRVRAVVTINPAGNAPVSPFPVSTPTGLGDLPFSTTDATVLRDSTGRQVVAPRGSGVPTFASGAALSPADEIPDATIIKQRPGGPALIAHDAASDLDHTQVKAPVAPAVASEPDVESSQPRGKRPLLIGGGVAAVVAVLGIGTAIALNSDPGGPDEVDPTVAAPIDGVVTERLVPQVEDLVGAIEGADAVFAWVNPDPKPGDTYLWGVRVGDATPALAATDATTVTTPASAEGQTCIEVLIRRADGRASADPAIGCTP
ncbi:MAG: serine/threonine protein kinase [Actinobacteria bacterium HGW-Actinobacteria-4]|nr:MAG: serine/threonine protein kinase [Actinobacteria bacterium HGW-Actinobacteria-4]